MSLVAIVGHNAETFSRNRNYLEFLFKIAINSHKRHYILCTCSYDEHAVKNLFKQGNYPIYDIIRYDLLTNEDITTFILPDEHEDPRKSTQGKDLSTSWSDTQLHPSLLRNIH